MTRKSLKTILLTAVCVSAACCACRSGRDASSSAAGIDTEVLRDSIASIAGEYPGEIGVGLIINRQEGGRVTKGDTVVVDDRAVFPMMSVFKLHQGIAVCEWMDGHGRSLDSVITIPREHLDPHTWSPMLKDHTEDIINLPVRELLRYTLTQSDNNASNWMFGTIAGTAYTDSLVATMIPRESFRIAYTEAEMSRDHDLSYVNCTSPSGAASLINRLFTDSILSPVSTAFLTRTLGECETGQDRIVAPLLGKEGLKVAHKTGSGYVNALGQLAAHNDVAFVTLPDGTTYSLAVFVKDIDGDERLASEAIARISALVYRNLSPHNISYNR